MEIELQRKLASMIQADKDINNIIKTLDEYPTEINLVDGTPLNHAVNYERNEIVEYLMERGANVNALYEGDYTPLMSAVQRNNIEIVKLFLKNGADVNLKDKYGKVALYIAVFNNNLEIIKLLVEAKADPFVVIKDGWRVYDSVKNMGSEEMINYFDSLKN